MKKKKIALVMGGRTPEHEVSVAGGNIIFNALDKSKYDVLATKIEKTGLWSIAKQWNTMESFHKPCNGGEAGSALIEKGIDVAFIIMHGPYGEDGTIQGFFEMLDLAYTGSNTCACAVSMNKLFTKQIYSCNGIPTPPWIVLEEPVFKRNPQEYENKIESILGVPVVLKSPNLGSSVGLEIVREKSLIQQAMKNIFRYNTLIMAEKFITGTEITCSVILDEQLNPIALPPTEIAPKTSSFFDYHAKYTPGATDEITPARINEKLTGEVKDMSVKVHTMLGCGDMSRTDMIIDGQDIYVIETNTIPGMTETSLLPQAAQAVGISFKALIERLISTAIKRHKVKRIFLDRE